MRKIIESGIISNSELKKLKSTYKKGDRVELLKMNDRQAPPIGTRGTVELVDDLGTIHVRWDTGSGLGVAYGEDKCVKISEAGIRYIKSSNIKDVVNGSGNVGDFFKNKKNNEIFSQVVEYVKSLKSIKDAKAMKDFCGYESRGKEIEKLYNSYNDSEKDDLYNYVVSVCKQYDSKYKSVFSKIIKTFSDLDKKEPNVFDALMNVNDGYFSEKICDKFYITIESKDYAGYANVNNKYCISIWLKGEDDDDWIGSADEDGFTYNLMGPSSCRKNLYVCVSKLYLCYAFEENINKIKSGIDNFIKDNF